MQRLFTWEIPTQMMHTTQQGNSDKPIFKQSKNQTKNQFTVKKSTCCCRTLMFDTT